MYITKWIKPFTYEHSQRIEMNQKRREEMEQMEKLH